MARKETMASRWTCGSFQQKIRSQIRTSIQYIRLLNPNHFRLIGSGFCFSFSNLKLPPSKRWRKFSVKGIDH